MTRINASSLETGGMDLYLRQIRDDSLLSAAEERELAEAIKAGDSDARSRMIRANLRLVVKIARDYTGRGMSLDDLIGEGNLGLIRAAEDFDPRFGTRFSTYASYWIKQAIRHALTNTTATIRLPAHMVTLLSKWRKAERALTRELGQSPTFDQIATALGLSDAQRGPGRAGPAGQPAPPRRGRRRGRLVARRGRRPPRRPRRRHRGRRRTPPPAPPARPARRPRADHRLPPIRPRRRHPDDPQGGRQTPGRHP